MEFATDNTLTMDALNSKDAVHCRVTVSGIVQGVGFRPTVWRYANQLKLTGRVSNNTQGVLIECSGEATAIRQLLQLIESKPPPNARIDDIQCELIEEAVECHDFVIAESQSNAIVNTTIGADLATCESCKQEIFNIQNRRQNYAFTNCTHCGPRLSITRQLPYDRPQTSMSAFPMCPDCATEYKDPADRRFHAQPNACPTCGPELRITNNQGQTIDSADPIEFLVKALKRGEIAAIKSLGGFHLAVDATNQEAVGRLRQRKNRPHKPLALMAKDITTIKQYCEVTEQEKKLLQSAAAPIVTLKLKDGAEPLVGIAPDQNRLGFMLPNTPLHHLLLENIDRPLVMTSGNPSGQPQCIENGEAIDSLGHVVDLYLMHNRDIVQRVDDSVVQVINEQPQIIRRARGYAPEPLALPDGFAPEHHILAMGGDLKNTFCLLDKNGALLSQHIGDLEEVKTFDDMQKCLTLYRQMKPGEITAIAIDKHPQYHSARFGQELCGKEETRPDLHRVQHHHAHIASCLGDNRWPLVNGPVLGIVLDGMGYSDESEDDNHIWGGEILLADYLGYEPLARLTPTPLPGGNKAAQQPWRNLFAQLYQHTDWQNFKQQFAHLNAIRSLRRQPIETLEKMIQMNINSPLSSSCGRLFDAVAAALGICHEGDMSYEGQAAMRLQALVNEPAPADAIGYRFALDKELPVWRINPAPMWQELFSDLTQDKQCTDIAYRFHKGLASALTNTVTELSNIHNITTVVLSGGVYQNKSLLEMTREALLNSGLNVLTHHQVPANDGGLAFGQALIAAARTQNGVNDVNQRRGASICV